VSRPDVLGALKKENEELKAEIVSLTEVIAKLRTELGQKDDKETKPRLVVKANKHKEKGKQPHKTRKKRAAEQNAARKKSAPTEIRKHALDRCPDCNNKLSGESVARRREVIDLPVMPPVQVTEHQVIKRWCRKCQKWHMSQLDLSSEVWGKVGSGTAQPVW
jgi:DNA repair exonuclease SbcCD ATPase subunit